MCYHRSPSYSHAATIQKSQTSAHRTSPGPDRFGARRAPLRARRLRRSPRRLSPHDHANGDRRGQRRVGSGGARARHHAPDRLSTLDRVGARLRPSPCGTYQRLPCRTAIRVLRGRGRGGADVDHVPALRDAPPRPLRWPRVRPLVPHLEPGGPRRGLCVGVSPLRALRAGALEVGPGAHAEAAVLAGAGGRLRLYAPPHRVPRRRARAGGRVLAHPTAACRSVALRRGNDRASIPLLPVSADSRRGPAADELGGPEYVGPLLVSRHGWAVLTLGLRQLRRHGREAGREARGRVPGRERVVLPRARPHRRAAPPLGVRVLAAP